MAQREFLIVEDDERVARSIARMLRPHGRSLTASTVREAIATIDAEHDLAAMVIDVRLEDGSGFDVLAHAKAKKPTIPALVITGMADTSIANRAFDAGASCVYKPVSSQQIDRFVRQWVLPASPGALRWTAVIDEWTDTYELTPVQVDILSRAVAGASRDDLMITRGVAESTIKKHVSNLLKKTGDTALVHAVHRVLRASTER
jgi:DNA-binding NarL/FixJ family response regulator